MNMENIPILIHAQSIEIDGSRALIKFSKISDISCGDTDYEPSVKCVKDRLIFDVSASSITEILSRNSNEYIMKTELIQKMKPLSRSFEEKLDKEDITDKDAISELDAIGESERKQMTEMFDKVDKRMMEDVAQQAKSIQKMKDNE